MKQYIAVFIATSLLLSACESPPSPQIVQEKPVIENKQTRYDTGELESEYRVVDGKVDGAYYSFYKNGNVKFSRNYNHNQLNGHSKLYDETGLVISDSLYKNNQLQTVTLFDNQGRKFSFYTYENDKQNGPFVVYYANGNIKMSGAMSDNQWEGAIVINNENGTLRKIKHYLHGILNGEASYYDDNGEHLCTVTYVDGIPSGDYLIYKAGMSLADCIN